VARLASDEKYKGYDRVIQALPEIVKDIRHQIYDSRLREDTARARAMVEKLGLEKHVIFCGYVTQ